MPGRGLIGNDGVTPARAGRGAGQRPVGSDALLAGRQRIKLGADFLDSVIGTEPARGNVGLRALHVCRFDLDRSLGRVSPVRSQRPSSDLHMNGVTLGFSEHDGGSLLETSLGCHRAFI